MVKHSSLSIPLKEGRRFADPINPNRFNFVGLTSVSEIVKFQLGQIPWVNPRHPNAHSQMARTITASAFENRGKFHLLNRGVTLIAEDGKLEHETLSVSFGTAEKRGLVDGGTTVGALLAAIAGGFNQSQEKSEQQFVKVQVFCGSWTDEEVVDLAEALNTSVQVDAFSIANLSGKFDWIKEALKSRKLPFKVSYFKNDDGEVSIENIIQWMALFMVDEPSTAYSSKEKCLDHYEKNVSEYEKCADVLVDMIRLSEYIPLHSKIQYNAPGDKKFKKLAIISDSTKGSTYNLPVLGEAIDFAPHKAWVFPLLASLRPALDKSKKPYKWKMDPFKLFDRLAPELMSRVNRSYLSLQTFNAVGRNPDLYELLAEKVENEI
jgi:hypothetical protein